MSDSLSDFKRKMYVAIDKINMCDNEIKSAEESIKRCNFIKEKYGKTITEIKQLIKEAEDRQIVRTWRCDTMQIDNNQGPFVCVVSYDKDNKVVKTEYEDL